MGEEGPVRLWYSWKVSPNIVKLAALAVALCVFIVLEMPAEVQPILGRPQEANNLRLNLGDPTYEAIGGAEVVWHSPPNPKAILFLAHGCNHQATDFWHPTSACPQCTGLPEEVRIARTAFQRGYAVVAVSSQNRLSRCWHRQTDGPAVQRVFDLLREKQGWLSQPLMALGASSGGYFVGYLPKIMKIDALAVQIMGLRTQTDFTPPFADGRRGFPPALFIHMPRDSRTAKVVEENVEELHRLRVPVLAVTALPLPINSLFFAERIDKVSAEASAAAVEMLKSAKYLDADNKLLSDPRQSDWRTVLQVMEVSVGDTLGPDESNVAEALNVAWAGHEITADWTLDTLDFFDAVQPTNELDPTKSMANELDKKHPEHQHPLAKLLLQGM